MKYNKKKHIDLVKYKKKLELEGKDLYDISEKAFFELQDYSAMQIEYIQWKNREEYFELIKEFLNEPMSFVKLIDKFQAMDAEIKRLESELMFFEPVQKCKGFGDIIIDLISVPDLFMARLGEENELSEKEVKELVEEIFLEMKNHSPLN